MRGMIDNSGSQRMNISRRGELSNFEVIRDFECFKCGHRKGFYKRHLNGYECTSCKNVQQKRKM